MIESVGYIDLAKGTIPTITGGSLAGGGPTFRGSWTNWAVSSFPSSLTLDLNPFSTETQIGFIAFGTSWREGNSVPKDYSIEYSQDATNWNTLASVQNNSGQYVIHNANNIAARYIRLNVKAPQPGQTAVYVSGLQVLSTQGPALYGAGVSGLAPGDNVFTVTTTGPTGEQSSTTKTVNYNPALGGVAVPALDWKAIVLSAAILFLLAMRRGKRIFYHSTFTG